MGACCADCTKPLPMNDTMKVPMAICAASNQVNAPSKPVIHCSATQ